MVVLIVVYCCLDGVINSVVVFGITFACVI